MGSKEDMLLTEAEDLHRKMKEAEIRQAEIESKLNGAEAKNGELREKLLEEQARAKEALDTYEMLTQQVEEAQIERDLANDKASGASDLERQVEDMKAAQARMQAELEESRQREKEREQELE